MANASLQIGNGNWAIKEDNLLGYSKAGTRFLPIPITMTRATLGTRVNPSGLVEDVALLGDELVTNGDFATDSNWSKGTGWTIANGVASQSGGNATLQQSGILTANKIYKLVFEITEITSGSVRCYFGGNYSTYRSSTGTYTEYITNGSTSTFFIQGNASFTGSIDNVSVKEATIDGLARVDYTDGTASLLVEPERRNLITYSEDFSNASWLKLNSTVNPNTSVSPDGTLNSDEFIPDNTTASIFIYNQITFSASDYTLSFFIKYNGRQYVQLLFGSNVSFDFSNFDLINHTVTSGNGNIEDYGNDWYKISLTSNVSAGSSEVYLWSIDSATSLRASSSTGNGTDGYYVYGGQLEQGSYPTSYIKTQGSSVTRNQDEYTKTGISDKINSEEGVLFLEIAALSNDGTSRCISIFQNASNFIKFIYSASSNRVDFVAFSDGNVSCNITKVISNTTENTKFGLKWKVNDFALWIDGTEVGTDLSGDAPLGMDKMYFTDEGGSGNKFFGKVKQLQIFKTALSDLELATLTS